jgi:hypothetical protein
MDMETTYKEKYEETYKENRTDYSVSEHIPLLENFKKVAKRGILKTTKIYDKYMMEKESRNSTIEKTFKEKLNYYGEVSVFKKRLSQGYTHATFGSGSWFHMDLNPEKYWQFLDSARVNTFQIEGKEELGQFLPAEAVRIVAVWVFFHPDERIATFEYLKVDAYGWKRPGPKIETEFSKEEDFKKFLESYDIDLVEEKIEISELLRYFSES